MSERIAIVHAGTHKTGTTSLQFFFELNRARFLPAGIYVAQAGRFGHLPGNHHVAWELLKSNASPHFEALIEELRGRTERTAVISSEDLSLLYARPEALRVLRDGLEAAGFTPAIVMYLRAQAPYAASMYAERIKHGHVVPLSAYLNAVHRDGRYVPEGSSIHIEFEYTRLLEPFVQAFGKGRVIVHPYLQNGDPMHIFRDFLAVMAGLDRQAFETQLGLTVPPNQENRAISFYELLEYAHGACDALRTTGGSAIEEIYRAAPDVSDRILQAPARLLSRDEILALQQRFASDNVRLRDEYGVALQGIDESDVAQSDDPAWEQSRAQRAIFDRLLDRWLTKKDEVPPQPE